MGTTVDNQPRHHKSDEPAIWLEAMKVFETRTAARLRHVANIVRARAALWVNVGLPDGLTLCREEATIAAGILIKEAWQFMGVRAKKTNGEWEWVTVNEEADEHRILRNEPTWCFRQWCLTVLDRLQHDALSSAEERWRSDGVHFNRAVDPVTRLVHAN